MGKVAVVGREDSILCFLASGFRAFPANGTDEAKNAVRRAKKEGCDVIFVTPDLEDVIAWADEKYGESVTPAVIPLPLGSGEAAKTRLTSFVERAVGANILGD